MNANNIKAALTLVHQNERCSERPDAMTRVQAVEHMIKTGPKLEHAELDILLDTLHVKRSELSVQWSQALENPHFDGPF
jgi:hypothetical protein